ncbi:MAG: hypothetical protein P4N24_14560 [Acidobacteriota bacterium]|nr:hypothetical protein [Acidobacteriota bacterium]
MQEKSTPSTGTGPHNSPAPAQDSPIAAILIATFFLLAPFVGLLIMAPGGNRGPGEDYRRAVIETVTPKPSQASHKLVSIDIHQPVKVVTWAGEKQAPLYKNAPTAFKETWVTVVPHLKDFCRDYVRSHGSDRGQLTLRLEQRLGLPPGSNNIWFVELAVPDPSDASKFFRPCGDPSPDTDTCQRASLPKQADVYKDLNAVNNTDKNHQPMDPSGKKKMGIQRWYWFLNKYYTSFATDSPYPWTSLGYTFDWAPQEDGSEEFVRWGESEFVIAPGTPIQFVSATDTVAYCSSQ